MIKLVDPNDSRAVRNKDNVLALYDLMINQKKSKRARPSLSARHISSTILLLRTVRPRWENTSAKSRANAPKPALSSTASSPSAIMSGRM